MKTTESVLRSNLLGVAHAYGRHEKIRLSTVSLRCRSDERFFVAFELGDVSITLKNYQREMQWFSDNWPQGAAWPKQERVPVGRPKKRRQDG